MQFCPACLSLARQGIEVQLRKTGGEIDRAVAISAAGVEAHDCALIYPNGVDVQVGKNVGTMCARVCLCV